MSIVEKIRNSVESATGLKCLYQSPEQLNRIWDNTDFPCAYFFLLGVGNAEISGITFKERVSVVMFFVDKAEYDARAVDLERIIQKQIGNAHKWVRNLLSSKTLRMIGAIERTQRVYEEGDVILTGYAIQVTVQERQGSVICDE